MIKTFTDRPVVYSRMLLIMNIKRLWFITMRNFTMPSSSVPQKSFRFCLLQRSAPA